MKRTRLGSIALTSAALAAAALAVPAVAATTGDEAAPSFQEFRSTTFVDTDQQFIVNGDEPVATDGDLRQFYDGMMGPRRVAEDGLIVNTVNGRDDKWSASQVGNLTYCVSTKFGADHARMVQVMGR